MQCELDMAEHHALIPTDLAAVAIGVHSDSLASVADIKKEYAQSKLMLYILDKLQTATTALSVPLCY